MSKPNVLFILADDQRYGTIHALGNPQIKTPNLDRLAREGTAFTQAHIPGGTSGAVCMPSRAMIHSGKTMFHLYEAGQQIPEDQVTLGQCFRENGWDTIGIGKWHNGTASYARSFSQGDNIFFGGMWDHWNVPTCSFHEDGAYDHLANFTPNFMHANHPMPMICDKLQPGKHSTELFTDTALEFLEQKRDKPFFLYLSFLAPHDPRTMPEEFHEMYRPEDIQLPENFAAAHPFDIGISRKIGETRDEDLADYPRGEDEVRRHIAEYYAMITHLDHHVGRLLDCLEKNGQLENTIIVFTGDNGLAVGQHGLMGKQSLYEHSIRVPLILRGPGIPKGAVREDFVYLLDLFPTLCGLSGLKPPVNVEGVSFVPALEGKESPRDTLYLAYTHLIRGVKTHKYKLLEYRMARDQSQLFDLENDPMELRNLYQDPQYAGVKKEMIQKLLEYKDVWEDDPSNRYTQEFWKEVSL